VTLEKRQRDLSDEKRRSKRSRRPEGDDRALRAQLGEVLGGRLREAGGFTEKQSAEIEELWVAWTGRI